MIFFTILVLIIFLVSYFQRKGIPIFLYHQVNNDSAVTPELFEEHLKILKEKKINTIKISDLLIKDKEKNAMLITLDDGYYDNYKYVFPLLKKYNMKATIFLNSFYIGDKREEEPNILNNQEANYLSIKKYLKEGSAISSQYMTWEEIREMHESGLVDFQAHSHKHTAIFENIKLLDVFSKDEKDSTDSYLYGEIKEGYPKFRKRGEYSILGLDVSKSFFDEFQKFYMEYLKNLSKEKMLKEGQKFIDENLKKYVKRESFNEFQERVKEDFLKNKELIEKNLNNKVEFFCWPWGHKSKLGIEVLKKLGIVGFVTTKKGTNSYNPNLLSIKRVELRDFSVKKFKLNLFICRNLILGKIYQLVS